MIGLRPPEQVMRLARMGSFHSTRLSFIPALLRRARREGWRYERRRFVIDDAGVGEAVYTVHTPERAYSLVCFAYDLPDDRRSDRVIATAWDATFALFDGLPEAGDLVRLAANVPRQEAGRVSDRELTLSRANRSVRLFEHVVSRLAAGRQPDARQLASVGYLMRTTAVYGSGKFGAADRAAITGRAELRGPFQAEMLTVWLIRGFVIDLVEHLAVVRGGTAAVTLDPDLRRGLGIGNSTGLGMAPFLINHPTLMNNWMLVRETALQRVRALAHASSNTIAAFRAALDQAVRNATLWASQHPLQRRKLDDLRADLAAVCRRVADGRVLRGTAPWDALYRWGEKTLSLEGQEALVAVLLEPHGALVDGLSDCMDANEADAFVIDGAMPLSHLEALMDDAYGWALATDFDAPGADARFWYVSEEKLEPRLGQRHTEPGAAREQPLATARDVVELRAAVRSYRADGKANRVADFLQEHSEHRHMVRRVQQAPQYPYAEIRDNLIAAEMQPIDMLRCKLSFFGASRFDPRSDRWVRICMYQDAPYAHELLAGA